MDIKNINLDVDIKLFNEMVNSYHETALWVDEITATDETDKHKIGHAALECFAFCSKLVNTYGTEKTNEILNFKNEGFICGHDFYLTRNGHGAGFWDRPEIYGETLSNELTEISREFGNDDTYWYFKTED